GSAYRECMDNGTWALKSNYSSCEPILEEKRKYPMHYKIALIINYLGHCISVGALVVAFILFLCLSIRCLRNIIHWNLITTFILRNVMWFLLQLIDHNIHESNEPWCRLITTIYNYFVVTNFFWMFVEGCYLHTAIVMTYSTDKLRKWVFLFIGWKAVKATLVLLPLLGITYMLFFVNPGEDDISQIVFIYFNSFLQSFQGFFVSVFYCFLNGEVRSAVRKRWHRWQDNHALRVRVARAMSIPTSPTRISFHSIKQTTAV
uniref:Corticotropin releasing hormone receptor 2 n=1 Tax=Amphilophus citrinellus TaxID=61819 RepID=A0A3Q0STE9_AMPCI